MVDPVAKKTEIKTIIGSISNDTKDTYESAIVEMRGNIIPEAVLRCHSLLLHGNLMGSVVCTGDVNINGDIGTDKKQKIAIPSIRRTLSVRGQLKHLNP